MAADMEFQSTRPVRGATGSAKHLLQLIKVSIHAPRAGRDPSKSAGAISRMCFNPRAPCGARLRDR